MPTPVLVAHVTLEERGAITIPVPSGWTTAFTVVAGTVSVEGQYLGEGDTPVFNDDGDTISLASDSGGQVLLMCGEPIGEPIVMRGGFVMNTAEEINIAFDDYQSGSMGSLAPSR
jgi:redox-sensitive bicupin YhaK (pirin superfamily)